MPLPQTLLDQLSAQFGERLSVEQAVRERHGRGESFHPVAPPDAVVFARSTEDVCAAVRACAAHGVPIVPFGSGTSLEGHVAALRGGVSIELSQMNAVLSVNADDMDVTVEAGVTHVKLNQHLQGTGLFFPVDPGADCSLGGMAATRAAGPNSVRYGGMRENVLSLEVVLADGRVIRTASRARKSAAGYDLTRLFIGSEGTLGIITGLTLRLMPVPEASASAVCAFPDLKSAVSTVTQAMKAGMPLARIELLDEVFMEAAVRFAHLDYQIAPTLFFELHGSPSVVADQSERLKDLAEGQGGFGFRWTANAEEGAVLWAARHKAYYAILTMCPGRQALTLDTCVPMSRLVECIDAIRGELGTTPLTTGIMGHAGEGNFHVILILDSKDGAQMAEAERLGAAIVRRTLEMEGTCTGEHGIGYGKIRYLEDELGDALDVMRQIKNALDPAGLLNPGKVLPPV
jgi:D-lactate dehydrogenase (cytochrome)